MKKLFILILIVVSLLSISINANSKDTNETIDNYLSNFSSEDLLDIQKNAGNNFDDWFFLSILRSKKEIDYNLYKGMLRNYIIDSYREKGNLSNNLITEWHRLIMLSSSVGLDPRAIVLNDENYNLLIDGIYNTKNNNLLEKQGINSYVFALIALDSFGFKEIDNNDYHSRKSLIENIISFELDGGGFAYSKTEADIDMTALVIQALSEYYNSLYVYNVYNRIQEKTIETNVKDVIDRALVIISTSQKNDGDFESYEISNVESTAQVLISLTSLGIDIDNDSRFIKNNNTVYDGIIKYQNSDGTFRRNDYSNKISGYQAFMGLVAYDRWLNNMRSIYDLKPEMNNNLKEEINSLITDIDNSNYLSISELKQLLERYKILPGVERNYVYNFYKLYNSLIINNIEVAIEEEYSNDFLFEDQESIVSDDEIKEISVLSSSKKINDYYKMIYFQEKIRSSNVEDDLKDKLNENIIFIKEEKKNIIYINNLIKEYLIQENEELKEEIITAYNNLSKDSKQYINDYEEVDLNNILNSRNLIICGLLILSIGIAFAFVFRIIKRKRNS
ncbi:MAG: terpene cyclase/mutase family protein [Bacilli bacterium]|nr:terpene cyclase/mutase family protein [Bacilli bacterium]MDD4482254.1 terpene cyclase/mutase family protein [Bacilli bacterium]